MGIIERIKRRWHCFRHGHIFKFDSYTLGGDWIRCKHCNLLEEYLPGLHEPKGYDYNKEHNIHG